MKLCNLLAADDLVIALQRFLLSFALKVAYTALTPKRSRPTIPIFFQLRFERIINRPAISCCVAEKIESCLVLYLKKLETLPNTASLVQRFQLLRRC